MTGRPLSEEDRLDLARAPLGRGSGFGDAPLDLVEPPRDQRVDRRLRCVPLLIAARWREAAEEWSRGRLDELTRDPFVLRIRQGPVAGVLCRSSDRIPPYACGARCAQEV